MARLSHLRSLQALELALRKGSLKDAARELAITPAALGQRVRALEDYLGFDLLVRGRSGIRATKELEGALAHLSAGFRELETVTDILDFQRVHEIHITADSDWAELWLAPRLDDFRQSHPNVLFCINGTGDVPVRLGEADFQVWFGAGADPKDQLLFHDYLLPISSPENTRRIAGIPGADRLEGFPLLHLDCYTADGGAIGWPDWIRKYGHRKTAPGLGIRYRRVVHALEAVYANSGLVVCGLALITDQIKQGALKIPFPIDAGEWSSNAYFLQRLPGAERREQAEQFQRWLFDEVEKTRNELRSMLANNG